MTPTLLENGFRYGLNVSGSDQGDRSLLKKEYRLHLPRVTLSGERWREGGGGGYRGGGISALSPVPSPHIWAK